MAVVVKTVRATLTDAWGIKVGLLIKYDNGAWQYHGLIPFVNIPNLRW